MTPQSLNPKRSKQEVEEIMCLNQKNSPLLRLPAEIRNKIFALALGEMTIYWGLGPPNTKLHLSKSRYNGYGWEDPEQKVFLLLRPFPGTGYPVIFPGIAPRGLPSNSHRRIPSSIYPEQLRDLSC
ncbi:hypothetical protein PTT_17386 [Pyrenophora teres f. teres 0-1]|uniref:Uncharacterized protein n=1 Tax=Pyrenophora teres f. teres (strain 0-1) TaxID=861557 RepID=E3S4D2_PYRTT|nr:hypothetical protein PTT_17386 [Pyrenophora teres f. teres 0-1]